MEEREGSVIWYRLRGIGLVCLCSLVFFVGAYLNNQRDIEAGNVFREDQAPVCSVQTEEKTASLTFDTAWEDGNTGEIRDILDKNQIKASFFVTGEWAQSHPEEIKEIARAGHDIGSFGMSYRDMSGLSREELARELTQAHDTIQGLTGADVELYRAPYGKYSRELLEAVEMNRYTAVQWNVDSEDWKDYGRDALIAGVTQNGGLGNGSIIRMHSGSKYTAQALDAVIHGLKEMGYDLVPVSQLLGKC